MAISITLRKQSCNGNGTATTFNFPFKVLNKDDFTLIRTDGVGNDTILQLDTDYSISNVGNDNGVIVLYPLDSEKPKLELGEKLTGYRSTEITQLLDFMYGGGFRPRIHENAFDKITMILQEFAEELERRPMLPITSSETNLESLINSLAKIDGSNIDPVAFVRSLGIKLNNGELDIIDLCKTDGSNANAEAFQALVGMPEVKNDISELSVSTAKTDGSNITVEEWRILLGIKDGVTAGTVAYYCAESPPDGWLVANGAEINRTDYSDLFTVIGTTFGEGDGTTTFNIPDLRGVFLRGIDNGRGFDIDRAFGSYQGDDNKSHSHSIPSTVSWGQGGSNIVNTKSTVNRNVNTNASGGIEARPKNVALLPCIKY